MGGSPFFNSPYGTVNAGVYSKSQYGQTFDLVKIPSGALVFQSRFELEWHISKVKWI